MTLLKYLAVALAAVAVVLLATTWLPPSSRPKPAALDGIPVGELASSQPQPSIGLLAPFPTWAPLPDRGRVIGAEVLPPQPPWGASALALIKIDDDADRFMAGYRPRLAARGFEVRRLQVPVGSPSDVHGAQFQSDDGRGGHVVYITFRGDSATRLVQLNFWSPPAPPAVTP